MIKNLAKLISIDDPAVTSPAEVRELAEGKLVVVHRSGDDAKLAVQEFTEYNNGWWSNDDWRCQYDSIADANKREKIVRVKKK